MTWEDNNEGREGNKIKKSKRSWPISRH